MEFDENLIKSKTTQEQIDLQIRHGNNNYILNMKTNGDDLILKISEEEYAFLEYFENQLTITDIKNMHKTFNHYSSFKNFVDYVKSQIENNKLKILKVNNEQFLLRVGKENIEIIVKKKNFDNETIKRNIVNERIKYQNKLKNLEEKCKKLISDNKIKDQEILSLKSKNNELTKENEEIKANKRQIKEKNKDFKRKYGEFNNFNKQEKKNSEKNNSKNNLTTNEKSVNEIKINSEQKAKTNYDNNINNNIFNKIKDIKKVKKLDVINEVSKQNEHINFQINKRKNKFDNITKENPCTNRKKILDNDVNSLNMGINKSQQKSIRKTLSFNDFSKKRAINKKIARNNNNNNNLNSSKNDIHNKTFNDLKNDNMNKVGNLSNKNEINIIYKNNTEKNRKGNYSNDNKMNEIIKNNLKEIKNNITSTPINCHHKKISFNNSNNKRYNSKKIQINKNYLKDRMITENVKDKSNKIFNNIDKERNNSFKLNENEIENNTIINNKNIDIKHNNKNLKLKDNLINFANVIENVKDSPIINAILQCLANVEQFVEYFLSNKEEIKKNAIQKPLSNAFLEMIENLWENNSIKYYFPTNCINIIQNKKNKFLSNPRKLIKFIFDNLHQELNQVKGINNDFKIDFEGNFRKYFKSYEKYFNKNFKSIISDLFYIKYYSEIYYFNSDNRSHNMKWVNILEFSLEDVKKYNNTNKKDITIKDCFKSNQNVSDFSMSKCRELNMSNINIFLEGPKVLIININNDNKNKLLIDEEINLRNFFYYKKKKCNYELISVITFLENNYFIAFCKSFVDKKWYKYFNSIVVPCSFNEAKFKGTPFLLFYSLIDN